MSLLIADEQVGSSHGIPYAIPYSAIDRFIIEERDGEYSIVVYTKGMFKKTVKARFSFNRCIELMEKIGSYMEEGKVLNLVEK